MQLLDTVMQRRQSSSFYTRKEIIKIEDNCPGSSEISLDHTGKKMIQEEDLLVSFCCERTIVFHIEFIMSFEGGYAFLFFQQMAMNAAPLKLYWENNIFSLKIGPGEVFFNMSICKENYTCYQQFQELNFSPVGLDRT